MACGTYPAALVRLQYCPPPPPCAGRYFACNPRVIVLHLNGGDLGGEGPSATLGPQLRAHNHFLANFKDRHTYAPLRPPPPTPLPCVS